MTSTNTTPVPFAPPTYYVQITTTTEEACGRLDDLFARFITRWEYQPEFIDGDGIGTGIYTVVGRDAANWLHATCSNERLPVSYWQEAAR